MSEKRAFSSTSHLNSSYVIRQRKAILISLLALGATIFLSSSYYIVSSLSRTQHVPFHAQKILSQCAGLRATPGPPANFYLRKESDRFENGANSTYLIRNATIWTGEKNGTVTLQGDLLLDRGIIKSIGNVPETATVGLVNLTVVDAKGAWVTPGLVDLHSHIGLFSAPFLSGAIEINSIHGPILPWLRSIDGFNTHDDAFQLAIAGGVTSVQVLPGSLNAIGGQAFMVKLRKTSEHSPSSMILEPPHTLNGKDFDASLSPLRWRHMKQACGENLRFYGTRMDSIWAFRSAYNEARKVKQAQDLYCRKAEAGLWKGLGDFPEDLKWEMLVDVLRGRVKISNHCYEAVDLDDIVRLTQEFQFPISSFHHASEAWLVPDVLKRTWGGTPAAAIFATNHRYKRESYRGSEFAARVLADNDIPVVMKSDHPVLNSRYLLHEAQQAHYFGLPPHLSLASVTSVPATIAGLGHRIGLLREGADADVVLWDSAPLHISATPQMVWIDGILQIPVSPKMEGESGNIVVGKGKEGAEWKATPKVPDWTEEREKAVTWEGLPPLEGRRETGRVVFKNVKEVWTRNTDGTIRTTSFDQLSDNGLGTVVVERGRIICAGRAATCLPEVSASSPEPIDLHGGCISPGLMSHGSPLGLEDIEGEPSTGNGPLYEAFSKDVPSILGDTGGVVRAVDALKFGTRNALTAYRSGVTVATSSLFETSPRAGVIGGLSTTFRTGSAHALEQGAIIQEVAALHVAIGRASPEGGGPGVPVSVSAQISGLRRLLFGFEDEATQTGYWFKQAAEGVVPLVIEVGNADIMTTLLALKDEVEERLGSVMRMVFAGATEAHLLAAEIGRAKVGVILNPPRPFPKSWDDRRILPGPPLSNDTALVRLLEHEVTVGLGVEEGWAARNMRFELQGAILESNSRIDKFQAYALATTNLEKLLGVRNLNEKTVDMVAYDGGNIFELSSKVIAVLSPQRGAVDLM